MAINPMQKKARNAFLGGIVLMLVVTLIIGGVLYYLYAQNKKKEEEARGKEIKAFVLNQDVKSGQVITSDMLTQISVYANMKPVNYVDPSVLDNFQLQDGDGNVVNTDKNGEMYIGTGSSKQTIEYDAANNTYYTEKNGEKEKAEIYKVPTIAKVEMKANTVLTTDLIAKSDAITTNDLRLAEYNMLTLPVTLQIGDYIDIRVSLGNGQDFIVVSKKQIMDIQGTTISLYLNEGEILMMNSAIVESYIIKSSNLYAIKYVEAGIQEAATKTYTPTQEVQNLIAADENIIATAKTALQSKFQTGVRSYFDTEKSNYAESEEANIAAGIQAQIEAAKKARENYLSELK